MEKRMMWIDDDGFGGWCCPRCSWKLAPPQLESTVAVLAFNRMAQQTFDTHSCTSLEPMDALPIFPKDSGVTVLGRGAGPLSQAFTGPTARTAKARYRPTPAEQAQQSLCHIKHFFSRKATQNP